MELNYSEFVKLVFIIKKLPCVFSIDLVDNERYYELRASEMIGSNNYFCKINSLSDPEYVYNFETVYKGECNKSINVPGMSTDVQELMIDYLRGILSEMKLLNKRIDVMVESGIGHDDLESED